MYGQGSNFNPQYRHGPPTTGPPPPMPSLPMHQAPPPPPPPYQHGMPYRPQTQPYPFSQPSSSYPLARPPMYRSPPPPLPSPPQFSSLTLASYPNAQPPPLPPPPPPPSTPPPLPPSPLQLLQPKIQNGSVGDVLPNPPQKPSDEVVVQNIETLCKYIVKLGPEFEDTARSKEAGNAKFAFLFGGELGSSAAVAHEYFLWMKRKCFLEQKSSEELNRNVALSEKLAAEALLEAPSFKLEDGRTSPADSDVDMEVDDDAEYEVGSFSKEPVMEPQPGSAGKCSVEELINANQCSSKHLISGEVDDLLLLQDLSPVGSSPVDDECMVDNKGQNDISTLSKDLPAASFQKTENARVVVEGGSPFRLIQGYASEDSTDDGRKHSGDIRHTVASQSATGNMLDLHEDKKDGSPNLNNNEIGSPSLIDAGENMNGPCSIEKDDQRLHEQTGSVVDPPLESYSVEGGRMAIGGKCQPEDVHLPAKQSLDEFGRVIREDLSDSESDGGKYGSRHRRWQKNRSRSRSPHESRRKKRSRSRSPHESRRRRRSRSPLGRNKHGRSRSFSPRRRRRSPVPKQAKIYAKHERDQSRQCFDFIKGKCFRGASCRYSHHDSEQERNKQAIREKLHEDSFSHDGRSETHIRDAPPGISPQRGKDNCKTNVESVKEDQVETKKMEDFASGVRSKEGLSALPLLEHTKLLDGDDALGQTGSGEISSQPAQAVPSSTTISESHDLQRSVHSSQSDSNQVLLPLSNSDQNLTSQTSLIGSFADFNSKHSQSVPSLNQMWSTLPPPPPPPLHTSNVPGDSAIPSSHYPQIIQNQTGPCPPPGLIPQPFGFHTTTFQPSMSFHQPPFHAGSQREQQFAIQSGLHAHNQAVGHGNAQVPLPVSGLSYPQQQSSYGQQQPPSSFPSVVNMVNPSFQRSPSGLPESSAEVSLSDIGRPKSSIVPHFNPFASTFEEPPASLSIGFGSGHTALGGLASTIPDPRSLINQLSHKPGTIPDVRKQFLAGSASGAPYDPLFDSIEPSSASINKIDLGMGKVHSANDVGRISKLGNLGVEANDNHNGGLVAESEADEFGEVATDAEGGAVENESPEPLDGKGWSPDMPGEVEMDQVTSSEKTKSKESRSMKHFKVAIADFVKEVLKPSWREGNMSKEAFKTIVKKTVDKVSGSVPSHRIPKSQAKINQYVTSSQRKVTKLVMGYVDKYVKM